ncbi:serine/threonine protein phosphatase [Magnetococcales bacterium HHB-1]
MKFRTRPIKDLQIIKEVPFPARVKFRQLAITGPPGAGKSQLIKQIGGWIGEGYLDLTSPWWRLQTLAVRPREVHLGFPCCGYREVFTVFSQRFLNTPTPLDIDERRIRMPPVKRFFFSVDWRSRYAFEFIIPSPEQLFEWRRQRALRGTHLVDRQLTLHQIARQVKMYQNLALIFYQAGLSVHIRDTTDDIPRQIIGVQTSDAQD